MSKAVAEREVDITKARNEIVAEIDDLWTHYQSGVEQIERKYFHLMGEKFFELRKTFPKKRGDKEFASFCKKHWPKISEAQRHYYVAYRKRLGPISELSQDKSLPPLREAKHRKQWQKAQRKRSTYKRIVDEELKEPAQFEIPRTAQDAENDLIVELAGKIISAGFRVLSIKMHPDKAGGSTEAQRRLNSAKQLLQDSLQRQSLRI